MLLLRQFSVLSLIWSPLISVHTLRSVKCSSSSFVLSSNSISNNSTTCQEIDSKPVSTVLSGPSNTTSHRSATSGSISSKPSSPPWTPTRTSPMLSMRIWWKDRMCRILSMCTSFCWIYCRILLVMWVRVIRWRYWMGCLRREMRSSLRYGFCYVDYFGGLFGDD